MLGNALATQKEQLNELLGRDVRTAFRWARCPNATVVELDLETARAKALGARPELRQSRLGVEQAELNRRITKSTTFRTSAWRSAIYRWCNASTFLPSQRRVSGRLLSWNPLDWGRRKHELAEATKTIEQSKNSAKDLEEQILVEVGDKFRKFQQTRALLHATDLRLASAQEKLRVTTESVRPEDGVDAGRVAAESGGAKRDGSASTGAAGILDGKSGFREVVGRGLTHAKS